MSDEEKRKVGRPRTRTDGPGEYVGFRISPKLKEQLQIVAAINRHSLSAEVQFRIERSFRDDEILAKLDELLSRSA